MRLLKKLTKKSKLKIMFAVMTFMSMFGWIGKGFAAVGESGWTIFKKVQAANTRGITAVESRFSNLASMLYNPAVLGPRKEREAFFLSEAGFAGDTLGGLLYGVPVKNGMIAGGLAGYDAGTMELNWIENGELKTQNASAQRDLMGIVSYGFRYNPKLSVGASLKAASSSIAEMKTAYAYAVDLGASYLASPNVVVSGALQNLGASTKFIDKENPLPASAYVGAGYTARIKDYNIVTGGGLTYNFVDNTYMPEVGAELRYNMVSMSLGYRFGKQESALQLGLGLNWNNVEFGYAYVPGIYLNTTHRVNMSYRFGGPSPEQKASAVTPVSTSAPEAAASAPAPRPQKPQAAQAAPAKDKDAAAVKQAGPTRQAASTLKQKQAKQTSSVKQAPLTKQTTTYTASQATPRKKTTSKTVSPAKTSAASSTTSKTTTRSSGSNG